MSLEITHGYLRARLTIFLIAFLATLAAGTAFLLFTLEQEKTNVKFGAALGTMAELSSELLLVSAQLQHTSHIHAMTKNADGQTVNHAATMQGADVSLSVAKEELGKKIGSLQHLYRALQLSAEGFVAIGESGRLTAEENGSTVFEPDFELSAVVQHIAGKQMPDAIRPMWEGSGATNLRKDIGEVISLANRIDLYRDLESKTARRAFLQLNKLADERIKPGITRTLDMLHGGMIASYVDLQKVLLALSAAMALLALLVSVAILFPMAKRISTVHLELREANRKFEVARDLAESSDRAKSEFLANMSHEIRTPMNGVLGMAELLAKTDLDTRQQTFTDVIVKSGNALLTIINDILDFSKIDAGQLELDPAPFDLSEAIEDVAALVSTRVAEKDLELIVRIDPELPRHVVGDVGRFRQIVTNLLGNAVKFTDSGHVLVDVSVNEAAAREDSRKSVKLKVRVEDTGIGIPEDKLEAIFQKFAQADSSSTRRHEGTGLGLAIASRLVNLMGGQIQVSSKLGEGTTFRFDIELPVEERGVVEKTPPLDVSGARILVIDDNPVNRDILQEQVTSWNLTCVASEGGTEGLTQLRQSKSAGEPIDCVILDYQMPGMNGEQVAAEMRGDPDLADIPVILLTSVDQADFSRLTEEAGLAACLTKPARSSILFDTLIGVLRRKQLQGDACRASVKDGAEAEEAAIDQSAPEQIPMPAAATGEVEQSGEPEAGVLSNEPVEGGKLIDSTQPPAGESEGVPYDSAGRLAKMAERLRREREQGGPGFSISGRRSDVLADKPSLDERLDILVAEDNEVNQQVFEEILRETGLNYLIVGNGKRAVAMHAKRNPGIILMDVSMPEMNGLEATRTIREAEKDIEGTHTPIVGVTAHALKGDRERCLNAGMDDYVTKPVSSEKLSDVIDRWLHGQKRSLAS